MRTPKPITQEVRAHAAANECGLQEARRAVDAEWRAAELRRIRRYAGDLYTVEQCRDVIVDLLDLLIED